MAIISDWDIQYNGKVFPAGEVITEIEQEEAERLISEGIAQEVHFDDENDPPVFMAIEEFSALKSDEQKEVLKTLEIDPGSNQEQRTQQYTEWYELQVNSDDFQGSVKE